MVQQIHPLLFEIIVCTTNPTILMDTSLQDSIPYSMNCTIVYNGPAKFSNVFFEPGLEVGPNIRLETSPPFNLSLARNKGAKVSKASYLVYVDDDIDWQTFESSAIIRSVQRITRPIVIVGGQVGLKSKSNIPRLVRPFLSELSIGDGFILLHDGFVNGALFVIERDFLMSSGGFNISLGRQNHTLLGGEESELIHKARAADMLVAYDSSIKVDQLVKEERLTADFVRKRIAWDAVTQAAIRASLGFSAYSAPERKATSIDVIFYRALSRVFTRFLG